MQTSDTYPLPLVPSATEQFDDRTTPRTDGGYATTRTTAAEYGAPLVPVAPAASSRTSPPRFDGGEPTARRRGRPPRTGHASPYTRDTEEIEPFVADLR